MSGESVLVVDDDTAVGVVLLALLQQAGFEAAHAPAGERALQLLAERPFDLVLTDLRMPGMGGMQLLAQLAARFPETPAIMMTAHGTIPLAVEAMKAGAADFVLKPFDRQEILFAVRKAIAKGARAPMTTGLLGNSPALQQALELIRKVARSESTVLLRGESGTGKELAARAVHDASPRNKGPFVALHCAALPETLLESELFGYEKGAFTGAACRKPGRVELAQGGTLFLDEIGDVTPAIQVKLLRLLQERTYERLGGVETLRADVRFVAATHRDLEEMVAAGEFRQDLFYRLNVVPIRLPALRERPGDVDELVRHFAGARPIADDALAVLRQQAWPGNVRELQSFIERLLLFSDGETVAKPDVERELGRQAAPAGDTLDLRRRGAEKDAISDALSRAKGNRTLAARLLGVSRRTLYNKLAEHGLA
jgi:DNA-binding NtrC family response regulator